MDIKKSGSQPSAKGAAEYFTGTVRIDPLFQAHDPARASGAYVTFEPGARSAWHIHPLGQTLIVTYGAAGCKAKAVQKKRFAPVTWPGARRKKSIGTAPR